MPSTLAINLQPQRPKKSHEAYDKEVQIHGQDDYGVCHFARWVVTGQVEAKPPIISRDWISTAAHHEAVTQKFFIKENRSFGIY